MPSVRPTLSTTAPPTPTQTALERCLGVADRAEKKIAAGRLFGDEELETLVFALKGIVHRQEVSSVPSGFCDSHPALLKKAIDSSYSIEWFGVVNFFARVDHTKAFAIPGLLDAVRDALFRAESTFEILAIDALISVISDRNEERSVFVFEMAGVVDRVVSLMNSSPLLDCLQKSLLLLVYLATATRIQRRLFLVENLVATALLATWYPNDKISYLAITISVYLAQCRENVVEMFRMEEVTSTATKLALHSTEQTKTGEETRATALGLLRHFAEEETITEELFAAPDVFRAGWVAASSGETLRVRTEAWGLLHVLAICRANRSPMIRTPEFVSLVVKAMREGETALIRRTAFRFVHLFSDEAADKSVLSEIEGLHETLVWGVESGETDEIKAEALATLLNLWM